MRFLPIRSSRTLRKLLSGYGMLLVLLLLCAYFSYATWTEQRPVGAEAGEQVAGKIVDKHGKKPARHVLIVAGKATVKVDVEFVEAARRDLAAAGFTEIDVVQGGPPDAYEALLRIAKTGQKRITVAATGITGKWDVFNALGDRAPLSGTEDQDDKLLRGVTDHDVFMPETYWWPNFLKARNLLDITNTIAVFAILAVGMTMVIITGGIDLSVGSLVALSAVASALLIRDFAGAGEASAGAVALCCLAAIVLCGVVGLVSGTLSALFDIPPFIATLGMMLIGRGLAFIICDSDTIYELPASFAWLGQRADLLGIPNAVVMTALLYVVAHVFMTQTRWGRYIYAVGGNAEAARLSGVPVRRVKVFVYGICGLLAGLGGVVTASQIKTGSAQYGMVYELYAIAAAVVGGTSLAGGEGKILGTLIGALIISVIWNGMNLMGIQEHPQNVIVGSVILGAVLLDKLKRRDWSFLRRAKAG